MGGCGLHSVFLRRGMTSQDTLGYGATLNIAPTIFPSATINATIPDENGIPQPWNGRVSAVEAGIGLPGFSGTYTTTPQEIANFLNQHLFGLARGSRDPLSPFVKSLHSAVATVGQPNEPPVRFLSPRDQTPLGSGMADWRASVNGIDPHNSSQPAVSPQEPGGLPGLLLEYLRNNPNN
jgi:hypothetical protein